MADLKIPTLDEITAAWKEASEDGPVPLAWLYDQHPQLNMELEYYTRTGRIPRGEEERRLIFKSALVSALNLGLRIERRRKAGDE